MGYGIIRIPLSDAISIGTQTWPRDLRPSRPAAAATIAIVATHCSREVEIRAFPRAPSTRPASPLARRAHYISQPPAAGSTPSGPTRSRFLPSPADLSLLPRTIPQFLVRPAHCPAQRRTTALSARGPRWRSPRPAAACRPTNRRYRHHPHNRIMRGGIQFRPEATS